MKPHYFAYIPSMADSRDTSKTRKAGIFDGERTKTYMTKKSEA